MIHKIQKYLDGLEREKEIKILLACETGSRAWGFPSPDSDYDIRIIYVHKCDWYLSVNKQRNSIETMLENNDLDISGWELKKSLSLLNNSNPPLLERIQSPIIYKADREFVRDILHTANHCYSKIASIHHYLGMSKKMLDDVSVPGTFKLKRFFYTLRTATLCKWIIDRNEIPPIEFQKAYKNLELETRVSERIEKLIAIKSQKTESYLHSDEPLLMEFIGQCIATAEEKKDSLPSGKCEMESLNQLLRKYVHKYDHR